MSVTEMDYEEFLIDVWEDKALAAEMAAEDAEEQTV
jgi:hypothetical protein